MSTHRNFDLNQNRSLYLARNRRPIINKGSLVAMKYIAIILMLGGIVGAALTYFGVLNVMPLMYWGGAAALGGIIVIFTRRPAD